MRLHTSVALIAKLFELPLSPELSVLVWKLALLISLVLFATCLSILCQLVICQPIEIAGDPQVGTFFLTPTLSIACCSLVFGKWKFFTLYLSKTYTECGIL